MFLYIFVVNSTENHKFMGVPFSKISKEELDQIVQTVIRKTNTESDEFEELDLTELSSIDEQIELLKRRDRVDTMYIT